MDSNPVIERYVARLQAAIADLDRGDREEIVLEIRNHLTEAAAAGRSLDAAIESLGSADALARAYAAELLVNPRIRRPRGIEWALRAVKVVVGSIISLIIVGWLVSMIALGVSGVAMAIVGVLEMANLHLPGVSLAGAPSLSVVIVLGLILTAIGILGYVLLRAYLRLAARAWRNVRQPLDAIGHAV
jgi:uncharacterized membrane protein